MTYRRGAATMFVAMILMNVVIVASAEEFQNPPDAVLEMDPSSGILSGVPVEFSANDSYDLFDFEHVIKWYVNEVLVSTNSSFVLSLNEGNNNVSLYVETAHGSDLVWKEFHVCKNPEPEIKRDTRSILYYDPYSDREINSSVELRVPLHASIEISVEVEEEENDDEIHFTVTTSPDGLIVADSEESGTEFTAYLFASTSNIYDVTVNATDEAGQTDTLEFRVKVGTQKEELKLERTPDSVNEEEYVELWIQHTCSYEVCDYSLVVEHQETGEKWDSDGDDRYDISFSDEGFVTVTSSVSFDGTRLDSVSKTFFVNNTENDPPKLWISLPELVYVNESFDIHVEAWDDSGPVREIIVKVIGDYVDDTRYNSTKIIGSEGTISVIPRRVDSYEIVAKSCDPEGECTEVSAWFDSRSPDEAPDDDEDGQENAVDWESEDTAFLSGVTTLFIIAGVVLLMRKQS